MENKKIGIAILATNAYFILGIRFIKKFMHHYKGDSNISFYFFSDTDPKDYIPEGIDVCYIHENHSNWVDGTNSKFKNILSVIDSDHDYLYYFDADTNISKSFTEEWFLGELVGGEHFGNRSFLSNGQGFDRNPKGQSYVSLESNHPYTYHYGAFFGGSKERLKSMCVILRNWQIIDNKIDYEPPVNDESYINKYFHYNPPTYTVPTEKFMFDISDKGGLGDTRDTNLDISKMKNELMQNKEKLFDIRFNKIVYDRI